MSVDVQVTAIDRQKQVVIVEAYQDARRIFKSPMPYKIETRASIESSLRKELKNFNRPSWGGMNIVFMCRIGDMK
ncbi:hypothetical protein VXQ92_04400 [Acinetobacter sp. 228]|uniref:hypothetical protein n=1 Tax=Acinetobacter sp. 228 TaxID=3114700 RepID=UPI003A887735